MKSYFKWSELLHSNMAVMKKIDNFPSADIIENLEYSRGILNKIREQWGKPIQIMSGYRNPRVNLWVGGATKSDHMKGLGFDVQTKDLKLFYTMLEGFKSVFKIRYLKLYEGGWVHISFYKKGVVSNAESESERE